MSISAGPAARQTLTITFNIAPVVAGGMIRGHRVAPPVTIEEAMSVLGAALDAFERDSPTYILRPLVVASALRAALPAARVESWLETDITRLENESV